MSNIWQVQDAKARFSEMLETSLAEGPQIVVLPTGASSFLRERLTMQALAVLFPEEDDLFESLESSEADA